MPNLIEPTPMFEVDKALEFLPLAEQSKIPLLFLESLKLGKHSRLEEQ